MSQLPNEIDIIYELSKYHKEVTQFYEWLFDYLNQLQKDDINKANQYEKEYFEELKK